MTAPDEPADLRIGLPERESARQALQDHLDAERLDPTEYEHRLQACTRATTRSALLAVFADLPAPHPDLPPPDRPPPFEEDPPIWFVIGCVTVLLGLPVAVVLGIVYGTWWALAVPVAVPALLALVEQLRPRP